jgi:hypothetical protein
MRNCDAIDDDDLRHRLRRALLARAYDGTEQHRSIEDLAVRRAVERQYGATVPIDAAVEAFMLLVENGLFQRQKATPYAACASC